MSKRSHVHGRPAETKLTERFVFTGCPFKGHTQRPQTLLISFQNLSIVHSHKIRYTLRSESLGEEIDTMRKLADSDLVLQRRTEFRKDRLEKT